MYRRTTPPRSLCIPRYSSLGISITSESDVAPKVFNTRIGRIGMLVCSELYSPELSRVLMLQRADVVQPSWWRDK